VAFRILVLCTGNSARSQIGEALLAIRGAERAAGRVEAASAGSRPAVRINPHAIGTLAAHGIAWHDGVPKTIDALGDAAFDLVITVCDNAREACPYYPRARAQVHWGLPDPAEETDPAVARRAFAATYDGLSARIDALLALPLEALPPGGLRDAAQAVHDTRPAPVW
jgi:arsenate reductase